MRVDEQMEFIVDGMLGKMARWLRMLGYDTKYSSSMSDDEILKAASEEGRVILTRDYEFFKRANVHGVKAVFVEGNTNAEKLADLSRQLNISLEININESRCPKCNAKIASIRKEKVKDKVPESTYSFYDEFWECSSCGQIYWKGSHWKKINNILKHAKQINFTH